MSDLFPEIDGGAPEIAAPPPALPRNAPPPVKAAPAPAGPRELVLGDRATVRRFNKLFALPGQWVSGDDGCLIRAVELHQGDRIKIEIAGGGLPSHVFFLEEGARAGAIASTRHLSLQIQGLSAHPMLRPVLRQVMGQLRPVTFAMLRAAVKHDDLQTPLTRTGMDRKDSFVYGYGESAAWRNFFESREMYRGVPQGRTGHFVQVHHTEIECHFAATNSADGSVNFMNYVRPDDDAIMPMSSGGGGGSLMSDLSDRDVIKGGNFKLDSVLDSVARDMEAGKIAPEAILVNSSCLSEVTGDDIDGALEKLKKRIGGATAEGSQPGAKKRSIPVLNIRNEPDPNAELMRLAMEDPAFRAVRSQKGAVNIVGLPKLRGHEEALGYLREIGIPINCWALPEIDMGSFRQFMAAEINVVHEWDWVSARRRDLIESAGLPMVSAPSPFGVEGTRAWLRVIAEAVGKRPRMEAVWARHREEVEPRLRELRGEAEGYRVGFVLGENGVAKLADPSKVMGIPLVPMLREMGFGIDLVLYDTELGRGRDHGQDGAVRVSYFATPEGLAEALRASPAVAFYSDIYFDRRLTRTGKNIFSSNDFEMGLQGAVSSAERVLRACRLPFFRLYSSFLGPLFLDRSTERPATHAIAKTVSAGVR